MGHTTGSHPSLGRPTASAEARDVVVVGAGPAGSATAALLAQAGHDVVLLDRASFPRSKPCSEYTGPGTEAVLARLGILREVDDGLGRRLRGMEIHAPNGSRHLVKYRTGGRVRTGFALPRDRLDAALLDAARARGVEVREGWRVTGLTTAATAGSVGGPVGPVNPLDPVGIAGGRGAPAGEPSVGGVVTRDDRGRRVEIATRLVVGADGRHSVVARALGLGRSVRWPRRLGLSTHYRGVPWPEDYGQMRVGRRGGYVGAAPLGDDLLTVGLVMPMPAGRLGPPEVALGAALTEYPDLADRLHCGRRVRPVRGVGPLAHAVRSCGGMGYLLVGDAAGSLDPFTGEGIHRALRGAELAAVAADRALRAEDREGEGRGHGIAMISPDYARSRRAAFEPKERLIAVIQFVVQVPPLMNYLVARLARRPHLGARLGNVLGDLEPPARAMRAPYLAALLMP